MVQTVPSEEPPARRPLDSLQESFLAVTYRRSRYALAIALSTLFFAVIGWKVAQPEAEWGGVSLALWHTHPLYTPIILALMLLLATLVCSFLVHPDSPHMGMFCAFLGLGGLSIRGGTIHMINVYAQTGNLANRAAEALAIECLEWTILLLFAESFARLLHDKLFHNTDWITRARPESGKALVAKSRLGIAVGVSQAVSRTLRTEKIEGWPATILAVLWSSAIALAMLYMLLQSQAKGQVFMACFAAFLVSTVCAYMAFPRVSIIALLLAVPVTAASGYLYSMHVGAPYPGRSSFFAARALPIDYFALGAPAVILGYYWALQWSLHSSLED